MAKIHIGFMRCRNCAVWSDIPILFKESKHFGQCPLCKKPMYLLRGVIPNEVGLNSSTKVVAGLMSQKGY